MLTAVMTPSTTDTAGRHPLLPSAGALLVLAACALPWPAVGRTSWNGFRFAREVRGLGGQLDTPLLTWVGALWFVVPLAAGVVLVVALLPVHHARIVWLVAGGITAAVSASIAFAAWRAGVRTSSLWGPALACAGGLAVAIGGVRTPTTG
jgi:hypothetical protein